MQKTFSQRSGFTLIEILLVITIMGTLAGIILVYLSSSKEGAQAAKAKSELDGIRSALEIMAFDTEEWPNHGEVGVIVNEDDNEIEDLNDAAVGLVATDGLFPNWKGPYIDSIPDDPWGNPYFFDADYDTDQDGSDDGPWATVIGSYGPNGTGLNDYDSDDVIIILGTQ